MPSSWIASADTFVLSIFYWFSSAHLAILWQSQGKEDAGYKSCLENLQPGTFHRLPAALHVAKLQAVFSQDSSAKVRRAGFHAWLALQQRQQGTEDCSDWDMSVLQVVKARCADRFVPRCMYPSTKAA